MRTRCLTLLAGKIDKEQDEKHLVVELRLECCLVVTEGAGNKDISRSATELRLAEFLFVSWDHDFDSQHRVY
jgi:hypothetical protein